MYNSLVFSNIFIRKISIFFISFNIIVQNNSMQFCQMEQCFPDFRKSRFLYSCSRYDHNVQTTIEHADTEPVRLSYQSGHSMSYNTVSYLFANRYAKSVSVKIISADIHYQQSVGKRPAVLKNPVKFSTVF